MLRAVFGFGEPKLISVAIFLLSGIVSRSPPFEVSLGFADDTCSTSLDGARGFTGKAGAAGNTGAVADCWVGAWLEVDSCVLDGSG